MSYRLYRLQVNLSKNQNQDIGTEVDRFLALNNNQTGITVMKLTANWKEGRSRSDQLLLNILVRYGGPRQWAIQFDPGVGISAAQRAEQFFTDNPSFIPTQFTVLNPPFTSPEQTKLLVIYLSARDMIRTSFPGMYGNYAPVDGNGTVSPGTYGTFRNISDSSLPQVVAMNVSNVDWEEGRPGILVRNFDGTPDDYTSTKLGGLPLTCYPTVTPPSPDNLVFVEDCACEPPPTVTTTSTTGTTTTGTTSSSTTTTMSTTSTTTSNTMTPAIAPATQTTTVTTQTTTTQTTMTQTMTTVMSTMTNIQSCPCGISQPTYTVIIAGTIHGCDLDFDIVIYDRGAAVMGENPATGIGPRNNPNCVACDSHFRFAPNVVVDESCCCNPMCENALLTVGSNDAGPGGACLWSTAGDGMSMGLFNTITAELLEVVFIPPDYSGGFDYCTCEPPEEGY